MYKKFTSLLLCFLLLSGCGVQDQPQETETAPSSIPTAAVQYPDVTEPVPEESLPAQIIVPSENTSALPVQVTGPVVSVTDVIPAYDANLSISFPVAASNEGSILNSDYFHLDRLGHILKSNGLFRICLDPQEMNQGSHYGVFLMANGGLQELPRFSFSREFTVQGETIPIDFEYSRYADEIILTYISEKVENFRLPYQSLGDGKCLITVRLHMKDLLELDYPMILDVEHGVLVDFLEGISRKTMVDALFDGLDLNRPNVILNMVMLEGNRLLVDMGGGYFYLYDTPGKNIYDLSVLSGRQLTGCAVVGEDIICWNDVDDYWRISIENREVSDLLTNVPYVEFTSGIWEGSGCSFSFYRDESWKLHVYDFLTDRDVILEEPAGWSLEGYRCHPSPDGRKAMWLERDQNNVLQILVFDCDTMRFLEIGRENPNAVEESFVQWTQDNAIAVISDTYQDFYVYQWKEMESIVTEQTHYPREAADFVAVKAYIPDILVDLQYAQPGNFTGHSIYEFEDAYLRYGTVEKLAAVQQELKSMGLGLKIWDGFRPTAAQFKLWEIYPDDTYVANPNIGFSNHSRGNAVDLTLVDSQGRELNMPTEFDDFSGKADRDYSDCAPASAENAILLQEIMEKHGFQGYYGEWWHYVDSVRYEVEHCFDPAMISQWYADCNEYITLRNAPDTSAEAITRIPAGGEFTKLGQDGEFFLVEYQGQRGYVLSSFTRPM